MEVQIEERGVVAVVAVAGSLDALTSPRLAAILTDQVNQGRTCLVGDFSRVDYLSSAGLGAILMALREARGRGGDLRLACVSPKVCRVFDLTGFTDLLKIFPGVAEAVASFQA
jgi:anti-sigma B factor antagonist